MHYKILCVLKAAAVNWLNAMTKVCDAYPSRLIKDYAYEHAVDFLQCKCVSESVWDEKQIGQNTERPRCGSVDIEQTHSGLRTSSNTVPV